MFPFQMDKQSARPWNPAHRTDWPEPDQWLVDDPEKIMWHAWKAEMVTDLMKREQRLKEYTGESVDAQSLCYTFLAMFLFTKAQRPLYRRC